MKKPQANLVFGGAIPATRRGPSLPRMAVNLGREAIRVAKQAVQGISILATAEETAQRLQDHCRPCDLFDPKRVRCLHPDCGCFLEYKTRLAAGRCPVGKW